MRGEDYSGGYGGGASCIKVRARVTFVPNASVASFFFCSLLSLTLVDIHTLLHPAPDGSSSLHSFATGQVDQVKLAADDVLRNRVC